VDAKKTIRVEVAYARADEQVIIPVEVLEGATLEQALTCLEFKSGSRRSIRPPPRWVSLASSTNYRPRCEPVTEWKFTGP